MMRPMSHRPWILAMALASGCAARAKPSRPVPEQPPTDPCPLNGMYTGEPLPPKFAEGLDAFHRASADYDAKRFLDAMSGFLAASRSFLDFGDREARRLSYENAVSSWVMANRPTEARARLTEEANREPQQAAQFNELLAHSWWCN
jgi:hypothetical protein